MLISRLSGLVSAKKSAAGPIFVGAGTPAMGNGSVFNVQYPSGIQSGDLLVLLIMGSPIVYGWTLIQKTGQHDFIQAHRLIYTSGSSVTVYMTFPGQYLAVVLAFRNVAANPIPVSTLGAISGTSITIPGVTTTLPNCMICLCTFAVSELGNPTISNWSNPNLTGLTEVTDFVHLGGGIAAACGIKATAGATGNTTANAAAAVTTAAGYSAAIAFAIAPAS